VQLTLLSVLFCLAEVAGKSVAGVITGLHPAAGLEISLKS
jgi:hypothetical protein